MTKSRRAFLLGTLAQLPPRPALDLGTCTLDPDTPPPANLILAEDEQRLLDHLANQKPPPFEMERVERAGIQLQHRGFARVTYPKPSIFERVAHAWESRNPWLLIAEAEGLQVDPTPLGMQAAMALGLYRPQT